MPLLWYFYQYTDYQFHSSTVNVSAETVGGSTPGVRVTWNTTVTPECVTSVTVEFRTNGLRGPVAATYTTTNTSETEVIQTGLQCATYYYITVVVTGELRPTGGVPTTEMLSLHKDHNIVQVLAGGKEIVCFNPSRLMVVMPMYRCTSICRFASPIWSES